MRVGTLGVSGFSLLPMLRAQNVTAGRKVQAKGGAEVCIFLFLQGGPSQMDTFDVKENQWTPEDFDIQTIHQGLRMPMGLLPELAERHQKYATIRSMEAWEAEHARGTYYLQAGRILSPARLKEIPAVGSIVAYEKLAERKDSDFLPPFISMDMSTSELVGCGMFSSKTAPMALFSSDPPPFVVDESERASYQRRRALLGQLDREWRMEDTHRGRIFSDMDQYYQSAYPMLENPQAGAVFQIKPEDRERYGKSGVGDALVLARNIVEADAGTRFIFVAHPGWDLHGKAYDKGAGQYKLCNELDPALSGLLDDLEARKDSEGNPLIDKTFIVCMGEFGRTPGELTLQGGRDHHRYAAVGLFAGAGVQGGRIIGGTDEEGGRVKDVGWQHDRSIYPEDVLVTMYSKMGIDWTKKVNQTPSGRPFEYIEDISPEGAMEFQEIHELFS